MIVVLLIIGVISGGLLAGVYRVANPLIVKNREKVLREAVLVVLPGARTFKKLARGGLVVYEGLDGAGRPVGRAFIAEGAGFQGKIRMMVGMDMDLKKIKGLLILENVETPGLGSRINEGWFQRQFKGLTGARQVTYVKNQKPDPAGNEVEAITGATISSRSVVDALNREVTSVRRAFGVSGR